MTSAIAPAEQGLDLALLKAVGLDRAAPEQRQLAIAIADRYGLDLMLKHLVLIEGRPYITRDALIHIAHRSGQFDGIEVTTPVLDDRYWRATATVWRRDMTHPFVYGGRYPATGGNARFAEEMAVKVAESMALRRAFDVAAPVVEERWDVEAPYEPPQPRLTLAERAAERAAEVVLFEGEPIEGTAVEAVETTPTPTLPPPGLSASALAALARAAGRTKGQLAVAIGTVTGTVPGVTELTDALAAMTDEQRGRLADELGLDWRAR